MTPAQSRAARALINWSQDALAEKAGVSVTSIRNFERGATVPVRNNLLALQAALHAAGIEFIGTDGVRLTQDQDAAQ
jgi:transcriptional regulator with XRE-family HTH domain